MAITIIYHQEPDGFWAESPDAPGFTAVAPTMEELEQRVEEGLKFYLESAPLFTPNSDTSVIPTVKELSRT